ncbi:MAG: aldo/keto reductase [Gemmatimonadetes bacterium]|nr:aldo/keto reductase [Gemmatimonadota bacterium]
MSRDLPRTILGRTNLEVTRFGIGGTYCETVDGYKAALDCGVNYIDTARSYQGGEDEKLIGQAIQGRRHELILASKSVRRDAKEAREELQTSLRALKTDYLDIFQLHHLNTEEERNQALGPGGALEAAQQAREEGIVRFIGVTGHDWVQVGQAVRTGHFDTVLCWYNCAMKEPEETVFPAAQAANTGVVIMNASRNEKLLKGPGAPAPEQFYRYVLSHDAVHTTVMGLRSVDLFARVAASLSERETITPEERAELEAYGAQQRTAGALE